MPVDLEKILKLSEEQNVIKKNPRKNKQKQIQNLTHWVVVINGKLRGSLRKNKQDCVDYLEGQPQLYEVNPTILRLLCHETIQCDCGLPSTFVTYKFKELYYYCSEEHLTLISEYA